MNGYDLKIIEQLDKKGYKSLNKETNNIYGRVENDAIYVVLLRRFTNISAEDIIGNNENIKRTLYRHYRTVNILNLFVTQNGLFDDNTMDIVSKVENTWLYSDDYGKLYIFENQPDDFDGLRDVLEKEITIKKTDVCGWAKNNLGIATVIILVINLIVYVITTVNPDMELVLADNYYYVIEQRQYYRIFTSMFVHFGIAHLVNNMIVLLIMGPRAERLMGRITFVISYLITGIVASVCSLHFSDYFTFSAGASGAICGIFGILIVYAIANKGSASGLSLRYLIFISLATILNGFTTTGIDNYAHIGGFISGLLVGIISILLHNMVVKRGSM